MGEVLHGSATLVANLPTGPREAHSSTLLPEQGHHCGLPPLHPAIAGRLPLHPGCHHLQLTRSALHRVGLLRKRHKLTSEAVWPRRSTVRTIGLSLFGDLTFVPSGECLSGSLALPCRPGVKRSLSKIRHFQRDRRLSDALLGTQIAHRYVPRTQERYKPLW